MYSVFMEPELPIAKYSDRIGIENNKLNLK